MHWTVFECLKKYEDEYNNHMYRLQGTLCARFVKLAESLYKSYIKSGPTYIYMMVATWLLLNSNNQTRKICIHLPVTLIERIQLYFSALKTWIKTRWWQTIACVFLCGKKSKLVLEQRSDIIESEVTRVTAWQSINSTSFGGVLQGDRLNPLVLFS